MGKHILVVDDHEHLRWILRMTLELHGYGVTEAEDGKQALERAQGTTFEAIICDIDMPVMHGLDFVRRYREQFGPATPIIMLSAEMSQMMEASLAAGANATVSKPFEPAQLLKLIQELAP